MPSHRRLRSVSGVGWGRSITKKSQAKSPEATVQALQRADVEGNGQPAGRTFSSTTATAAYGHLHLQLETGSVANFVWRNWWGESASAAGNAVLTDTLQVQRPGVPAGTLIPVAVTLGVDATATAVNGSANVEATLAVRSSDESLLEIRFSNTGQLNPVGRVVFDRQFQPARVTDGDETAIVRLRTGVTYFLDAVLQGDCSSATDINPSLAPEARIANSHAAVSAGNTAHIGLTPLVADAHIVTGSHATYELASVGPALLASAELDGPYLPVSGAQLDLEQRQIKAPMTVGRQFYRLAARWSRPIVSATVNPTGIVIQY